MAKSSKKIKCTTHNGVFVFNLSQELKKPADFILNSEYEFLASLEKLRKLITLGSDSSMSAIFQTREKLTRACCVVFSFVTIPQLHFTHSLTYLAFLRICLKSLIRKMLPTFPASKILLHHLRSNIWVAHLHFSVAHGPAASASSRGDSDIGQSLRSMAYFLFWIFYFIFHSVLKFQTETCSQVVPSRPS